MNSGQNSSAYEQYVGVDIGAEGASIAVLRPGQDTGRDAFDIEQTAHDMHRLHRRLLSTGYAAERTLVVMEATANYWIRLATSLHQAGFVVSVINPRQAHHFAQALLQRAKTDVVDAKSLAELAIRLQPEPWSPPPAVYEELQQRLTERDDLLNIRQQLRNQRHALHQRTPVVAAVDARLLSLLETVQAQIDSIDREIDDWLRHEPRWASSAALLVSIKGIGAITAAWLLVATHNFTDCHAPEQLAAYAGLVPIPHQSGKSIHRREMIGHAGHAPLRRAL